MIEVIVGMLISSLVLAAAYSLWRTHQVEGMRLSKKIEVRNGLTLAAKRLQRSVTMAGIGLSGAANLAKEDAVGSDTLTIFSNPEEKSAVLISAADRHVPVIQVDAPAKFLRSGYVALVGNGNAEFRRVISIEGPTLHLESAFANDYPIAGTRAMPAMRERYYSDQDSARFLRETSAGTFLVASHIKNFQVSFSDMNGRTTILTPMVRTVRFSLTGIYPAKQGALSSMIISSTAIPRNLL